MIRNYWVWALGGAVALGVCSWCVGQEGLPAVTEVVVRGNERVSTERVLYYVRVRAGDVYTEANADADVRRLVDSGLFAWAKVVREPYAGGYRVIFEVVETAIVKEVGFRGNTRIRKGRLAGLIATEVGKSLAPYTLRRDVVAIEEYYAKKGFPFADVRPNPEVFEDGVKVFYDVSEGPRVRVEGVRYRGNVSFSARTLRRGVKTALMLMGLEGTKKGMWIFSRGRLNVGALGAEAAAVEDFYRERGWLDCRVEADLDFNGDKSRAVVTMVVDEGPLYRVGKLEILGDEAIEREEIVGRLKAKEGEALSMKLLEQDAEAIRLLYGSRGYADASARYTPRLMEDGRFEVVWEIVEGEKFRIGRVEIIGNHHTKDKVVRREVRVYPGETYNGEEIKRTEVRLKGQGYFEKAEVVAVQNTEEGDVKDILVRVSEGRTGQVVLSAGITSNLGFAGSIQVRQRNFDLFDWPKSWRDLAEGHAFVGGGQTLSLRYEPGVKYHVYQMSFREPYLFDRPIIFGVNLFDTRYARTNYDEGRRGVELTFGRRFKRDFTLELGLMHSVVDIDNVETDAPSTVMAFAGENIVNSVKLSAAYDKRDRMFGPSSGYRLGGELELGGTFVGGDVDYLKETASASFYKTLAESALGYKHVGALAVRGGFIEAIDDTEEVPFFERFYVGGQRSLRGFRYRGIGPRESGDPIGGTVFATGSLEYIFPLYEDTLRGVFFVDAGNLAEDPGDFEFDEFRVSAGAGVRFIVPFLGPEPLSVDFGFPIKKEPGDDTELISFGLAFGL